jgi:hypothetical protein
MTLQWPAKELTCSLHTDPLLLPLSPLLVLPMLLALPLLWHVLVPLAHLLQVLSLQVPAATAEGLQGVGACREKA